jgi:hypothetical protein
VDSALFGHHVTTSSSTWTFATRDFVAKVHVGDAMMRVETASVLWRQALELDIFLHSLIVLKYD